MSELHLTTRLRKRLRDWSRLAAPREACGVLIGTRRGERTDVERAIWARNVDGRADRYEVDPEGLLAAERAARATAREVVGVWHSHPSGPAAPSETDRRGAYAGWSYVIVAGEELGSFRVAADGLLEEALSGS